jgi:hypothetical protein
MPLFVPADLLHSSVEAVPTHLELLKESVKRRPLVLESVGGENFQTLLSKRYLSKASNPSDPNGKYKKADSSKMGRENTTDTCPLSLKPAGIATMNIPVGGLILLTRRPT